MPMKHTFLLIVFLTTSVLFLSCALPMHRTRAGPITITVIDENTNQPLEGISVYTECYFNKPRYFLGIALMENGTISSGFSRKYITNKDGKVEIPERAKLSAKYNNILDERYYVNLHCPNNQKMQDVDKKYGGVLLIQNLRRSNKAKQEKWENHNNSLIQFVDMGSDELTKPTRNITLKLRHTEDGPDQR